MVHKTYMVFEQTSDTSTFKLIFSFDFDFLGFVFDIFFFRLVELLLFELFNDTDDRRPDFERSFVLLIAVPLIFLTDEIFSFQVLNFTKISESMPFGNKNWQFHDSATSQ